MAQENRQEYTEGYFKYKIEEESVTITGYFGKETEVTVPAFLAGYPVSTIAKGAFSNAETVKQIILPDTIMRIEEGSFHADQKQYYTNSPIGNSEDGNPSSGQSAYNEEEKKTETSTGQEEEKTETSTGQEEEKIENVTEDEEKIENVTEDETGIPDTSGKNNNPDSPKTDNDSDDGIEGVDIVIDEKGEVKVIEAKSGEETTQTFEHMESEKMILSEQTEGKDQRTEDGENRFPFRWLIIGFGVTILIVCGIIIRKKIKS